MNRTERFYKIDQLLQGQRVVSQTYLLTALEVSPATLKRDLAYMRERLNAPIVWDREARGYRLQRHALQVGATYQLPGLWFSAPQLYALLAAHRIFTGLAPSALTEAVEPLREQICSLLAASGHAPQSIDQRVSLLSMAKREVAPQHFQLLVHALLERKQLAVHAWSRSRDEVNQRTISPQRLVHYRDNWYVDAWCHWREAVRSFAVETLQQVQTLDMPALEVPVDVLQSHLSSAYGIFSGQATEWAVLRFAPERARWGSSEQWHPKQQGQYLADGSYELRVPYRDSRELVMDVLRHGSGIEVLAPPQLRQQICHELVQLAKLYKI